MSKYKELPQATLDGMSRAEADKYWELMEEKRVRDKFAMAALNGLLSSNTVTDVGEVILAFKYADLCMIERDK